MSFDVNAARDRISLYSAVREYFAGRGYLEVETPVLTPAPIPESSIELFRTDCSLPGGAKNPLYLLPSPEMGMKLLLADGAPSLFQIARCFRNGEEIDRWHRQEFTMLEWYGLGSSTADNLQETQNLIAACAQSFRSPLPPDLTGVIRRMSMEEAFEDFAGFSLENDLREAGLSDTGISDPLFSDARRKAAGILHARLQERGLSGREDEDAADLFHRLFIGLVEHRLPADRPLALTQWPSLVPTLARALPRTPWVERWELYLRGLEVANCYGEENKRANLEAYWLSESLKQESAGGRTEAGADWPQILAGMPPCSGVALGMDRLLALMRGDANLEGLDHFGNSDKIRCAMGLARQTS